MSIISLILVVLGLCVFEVINSIDNAVINAEVLSTMKKKSQKWFLTWGLLFAVFILRGLLPWAIVWATSPSLGPVGSFMAAFSHDPKVKDAIESSSPLLLIAGGTFLTFLFFHWLFMEPKNYGLRTEPFFQKQGVWFYAVVSIFLAILVWFGIQIDPLMAFGAVIGSTSFFIIDGFKENAQEQEQKLLEGKVGKSDISKILYLEMVDAAFSIDGVLGAFAFTLFVPVILIGNGLGAIILRQLTVGNIDKIKQYRYLKNGAMYSILCLGMVMILNSFGFHIEEWLSPVITFVIVGYFFFKSKRDQNLPAGK
jgi:hypothetical protein